MAQTTQVPGSAVPARSLSVFDATALMVGMVIGVGIFGTPWLVAINSPSVGWYIALWVVGGLVSLLGVLCYAELAGRHPDAGGEYNFLTRAYGPGLGFLFAWGRLTVIQAGIIAAIGFLFGQYMSRLGQFDGFGWANLGTYSDAAWAMILIVTLSLINYLGTRQSTRLQNVLTVTLVIAFSVIIVLGLTMTPTGEVPRLSKPFDPMDAAIGQAFVFVMLTYGGWNETVYLSGELKNPQRNMVRVFLLGLFIVTAIYLLLNLAYVNVLGIDGVRASRAVGTDMMKAVAGTTGALLITFVILTEIGTTLNATIFTGARTNYALGRDFRIFGFMGQWSDVRNTPANAILVQTILALILVCFGALQQDGFKVLVEYTAPVFWSFMLLNGIALFIFRSRDGRPVDSYAVHLYPVVPALFCVFCAFMIWSGVSYAKLNGLAAVGVLLAGIPVYLWARSANQRALA
ncbi:MAG: amino acid permease [Proteobacteria bacterium]|nr:amino acid permease [Burkholderiales bacterium]